MAPEEVTLQVTNLTTGTPVITELISICTTYQYSLDPGSYRVRATYNPTGEALQQDITITSGITTPLEFHFAPPVVPTYTLTVATTVGGTTNPSPASYVYDEGTTATVTAIPSSGYRFSHWILDGVTRAENPINILMDRDYTLTAYFEPIAPVEYTLTIATTTGGSTNPAPGNYTYAEGSTANVTALPASGYIFDYWSLDSVTRTENPITLTIDRNYTLTAHFRTVPPPTYTLTILTPTNGTTNPSPGTYTYNAGITVQVTAIPNTGYNFNYWTLDGITYTSNPINVLINRDHILIAYFSEIPPPPPETYKLNISSTTGGTTDPPPAIYDYTSGTTATVTATPQTGYYFNHWELDGTTRTENPITISMNQDHTLLVVFSQAPPPIPIGWILVPVLIGSVLVGYLLTRKKD